MNLEGDFAVQSSTSSARSLAAAGADSMRSRIDELVTALRAALEDLSVAEGDACEALDEKLGAALDAAEDVRDGLGRLAFVASQAPSATSKRIDIHEPLELALRMTRSIVGRRARLVRRYEPVPAVDGDPTALMRVFAQLLQNAADAIPPYMPLANCIAVRTYVDADGGVAVEVSDTGIGIPEENMGRVFEPFFTSKMGAAAGLGLTIARGEVTAAGGRIVVDSVEGRGSRFTVHLPSVPGSARSSERVFTSELPHRRVLVVADEPSNGERLRAMFADARTVVTVSHADEAVDRLAMGEACDLVVVDADEEGCDDLRERLSEVAPDVVMKTFEVKTGDALEREEARRSARDGSSSGMWRVAAR